ncbi:MAG: nitrogen fixation protein NifA [Bdellovibrionaceae bacterium]|nr:nitrogen fixation protein NifA [Pseudobdellovibrionaceae bacterium]|tara:strand:+ start:4576 stop:6144 length:1569 start_codon:yes stop_codon:yes gene_type:complete
MINWDELKHTHVVRKLEQVIGQWFGMDIFYVDERGYVRNFDLNKDRKNPLSASLCEKEKSRELFFEKLKNLNEKVVESEEDQFEENGFFSGEKLYIARVTIDQEYLGFVCAYSFFDQKIPEMKDLKKVIQSLGGEPLSLEERYEKFTLLDASQKKYFQELVGLVAQEIVTFHTEISKREERILALNNQLGERYRYDSMIGKSKPMQDLYSMLDKVKASESTVLVQGENGTGKELIAKAVHFNSPRKDRQFVTVNCSAFNENLLDSELFGHVKGAFTGAVKDKKGLFEVANGGTLFLDEIGDMDLSMQVKLLRVLQEGTLIPVGGTEQKKVDVRVIAATNKPLQKMIEEGSFREDLYYRVNVINIHVPALRERKEDLPLLIEHFIIKGCKEKNLSVKTLSKRAMEKIYDYPWPGNIRQLENEMERLIVLSGDETKISAEMLSTPVREHGEGAKVQGVRVSGKLKDALEELERTMIKEGLKRTKWNKSRLAKELGISRAGLIMKVDKYELDKRKIAAQKKDGVA